MVKAQQIKKLVPEVTQVPMVSVKPVNIDSLEGMTHEQDKMVSGVFKNLEQPGQPGYVACRIYKGQPLFSKYFFHDEIATIPLSVAKYINTRTSWTKFAWNSNGNNGFDKRPEQQVQRYQFVSREFA
jgi:hypothetical protein